ncbi:MAG: aldo/keto reductase [Betaproteobacteria bacterium]
MNRRRLGRTGLTVSLLGLGGIPIQRVSPAEAERVVAAALEAGVTFFDTARNYTDSEAKFGAALRPVREGVVLATKTLARTAEAARADLAESLRQLGTDYIDLYQLHNVKPAWYEQLIGPGGALEALLRAKQEGAVRFLGITSHRPDLLLKALELDIFDTIQVPYSYLDHGGVTDLLAAAERADVGVIAMKPLAGGALAEVAGPALRFLANQPAVSVIIPGADSPEQVWDNLSAVDPLRSLGPEEEEALARTAESLGKEFCHRCDYCQPCPAGIDIPMVFILEGYRSRYQMPEWAAQRYAQLDHKPGECRECGLCEQRCPYDLPIRERLRTIRKNFENGGT